MPELYIHRNGDMLETTFGEHHATIPWADVEKLQLTLENAQDYGRDLFEYVTQDAGLHDALTKLLRNTRLVLLAEQTEVAAIHWEYMRLPDGILLAARHNLVRGVPGSFRRERFMPELPLNIVAVPVSPLDEPRTLNTEGEWRSLMDIVKVREKKLTLTRVRPPTRGAMMSAISGEGTTIVQFMEHSNVGVLLFENDFGTSEPVNAEKFVDALDGRPYLVILNSCYSAVASTRVFNKGISQEENSHLGNIARTVVLDGIPYVLGMQFALYDYVALKITDFFYDFLLKSNSVEEAVSKTRARLEDTKLPFEPQHDEKIPTPQWLAGVPILYTNQREPAPALPLSVGQPTIDPDPGRFTRPDIYDLNALPTPTHFVGRSDQISEVLKLFSTFEGGFIVLHGLGGIGKTALSRAIAERMSWKYNDRVLSYSFETFTRFDSEGKEVINEQFAAIFYSTLATYYGLDPADSKKYPDERTLQNAIIMQRKIIRSLLVLDNIETLINKQKDNDERANQLSSFVTRLIEDKNVVFLTSRNTPPSDWGHCKVIELGGLNQDNGARLFFASIQEDRQNAVTDTDCKALSRYVGGHPLSIRLLAGRFSDDSARNLHDFLMNVQNELASARQKTPQGEDPNRHATLSECLEYSIRRLTDEQKKVLYTVGIFLAPFLHEWAEDVLDDKEQTRKHLQDLVRLGLLERNEKVFEDGELVQIEMHPMLRQHIKSAVEQLDKEVRERYGLVYKSLARQASQNVGGYDSSETIHHLIIQSLLDCEAALKEEVLSPADRSSLAYHLAELYELRGQIQQALALFLQSQTINQELGDVQRIAATQHAIADMLRQQGRVSDAMNLYKQSLKTKQIIGDMRGMAVTQYAMAYVLVYQGNVREAMKLFEQSLTIYKGLEDKQGISVIQHAMAYTLVHQGNINEAMKLYEQSLVIAIELGNLREIASTQHMMADVLVHQGRLQEAMQLYEAALKTIQKLGDMSGVASTQEAMAILLERQGQVGKAMQLHEQALTSKQEMGNLRDIAVIKTNYGDLLWRQGEHSYGLQMAWEAYSSLSETDFPHDIQDIQAFITSFKKSFLGDEKQFDDLWLQTISISQPDWLRKVQVNSSNNIAMELDEETQVIFDAIVAFVNTPDRVTAQHVLEERKAILFQDKAEEVFDMLIKSVEESGEQSTKEMLEIHFLILKASKRSSIEQAFAVIENSERGT